MRNNVRKLDGVMYFFSIGFAFLTFLAMIVERNIFLIHNPHLFFYFLFYFLMILVSRLCPIYPRSREVNV